MFFSITTFTSIHNVEIVQDYLFFHYLSPFVCLVAVPQGAVRICVSEYDYLFFIYLAVA